MKVTIKWTNPKKEGVRAICNVELLKGSLTLYSVRIIEGSKGLFAAAQSIKKDSGGGYYSTAYISEDLSDAICAAYKDALKDYKPKGEKLQAKEKCNEDVPF